MDAQLKAKWVEALRSGTYHQGRGCLRNQSNEFCCLGVLADIAGLPFEDGGIANAILVDGILAGYRPIQDLVGKFALDELWNRNDGRVQHDPHNFSEIADYIEANVPVSA